MNQTTTTRIIILFFLLINFAVQAQTWTGSVNSDWNTAGNWSPASVPGSSADVTIPETGVVNNPVLSGDVTVNSLTLEYNRELDTKGYLVTISGTLSLMFGVQIKNSAPGTDTRFVFNTGVIDGCTFAGDVTMTINGSLTEGRSNYDGNVKFLMNGSGNFILSNTSGQPSVFPGDLEIERTVAGVSKIFNRAATINGNFKYTNLIGGNSQVGQLYDVTTVTGKIDMNIKGAISGTDVFSMQSLQNSTTGGLIVLDRFGMVELSSSIISLTSIDVKAQQGYLVFYQNSFQCNVTSTGTATSSVEFYSNTISGNSDFTYGAGTFFDGYAPGAPVGDGIGNFPSRFFGNVTITRNGSSESDIRFSPSQTVFSKDITFNGSNIFSDEGHSAKFVGAENSVITASLGLTFLTIQKESSAKVILNKPLTITQNGQLTLVTGYIEASTANPVNLLENTTVTGASDASHIIGPVIKNGGSVFTFPIGTGLKLYPVRISPVSGSSSFSAEYLATSPTTDGYNTSLKDGTLHSVYDDGYWDIKRVSGFSSAVVTLGYNVAAGKITDQSKLRVAHWNGSIWEDLGNGGTSGSLTVGMITTASGVTSFSPFTIATADASNPLPVKLISFSVQKENQTALLAWSTTEELNSDRFEIEHSENAVNWQKIGEVKAVGESKSQSQYNFTHTTPFPGPNYYRLKMMDLDNTFAYSKIETLKLSSGTETVMYPNPVSNKLFINTANGTIALGAAITNTTGVDIMAVNADDLRNGIDLSKLSVGAYFVKITLSNGQKETHKIFVSR